MLFSAASARVFALSGMMRIRTVLDTDGAHRRERLVRAELMKETMVHIADNTIAERTTSTLSSLLRGAMAILLVFSCVGAVSSQNLRLGGHWGLLWLVLAATVVVCWKTRRKLYAAYCALCGSRPAVITVFCLLVLIQLLVFVPISGVMSSDAGAVFSGAFSNDAGAITDYLSMYQNNMPLYVFERSVGAVFGLGGGPWTVRFFVVVCCLAYDSGFLMLMLAMGRLFGRRTAVATGLVSFAVLGMTNQMYQFYTTALSWPFTCLGLYLYVVLRVRPVAASMWKLSVLWLLFGVTVAFGYIIRPSSIIYCIALVIIEALCLLVRRRADVKRLGWKRILLGGIAVVCGVGLSAGSYAVAARAQGLHLDENRYSTMSQFLAYGITGEGGGDLDTRRKVAEAGTVAERKAVSIEIWKTRLRDLGVGGYADFLVRKHVLETQDGSFGLLSPHIDERYSDNVAIRFMQNVWYSNGRYVRTTAFCMQVVYLIVLLGALAGVVLSRERFTVFLMLSLLGWHMFLLLFEGARTGYTIQAFPVMIPLAVLGFRSVAWHMTGVSGICSKDR